ncbi:MAG: LytTR family DNA-binding domain-containing protein, partial [Fervidobacterium sp.]
MLEKLLKEEGIEILGIENDPEKAVKVINDLKPDVIFLDINLGHRDGFYVIENISYRPYVVFTTAYSEYAVKAFEENAIDYMLKPIKKERLKKALKKLEELNMASELKKDIAYSTDEKLKNVIDYIRTEISAKNKNKIPIETDNEINFVDVDDIIYLVSGEASTFVLTNEEKYRTKETLREYEKKLPPSKFLRVHKSYIISVGHIKKILKNYFGSTSLVMDNDDIIPIGRMYKENIKKLIDNSI